MEKTKTNAENSVASSADFYELEDGIEMIATKIVFDHLFHGKRLGKSHYYREIIIREAAEDLGLDIESYVNELGNFFYLGKEIWKEVRFFHSFYKNGHPYKKITEEVRQSIDDAIKKAMDNIAANGYRTSERLGYPYPIDQVYYLVIDYVTDELGNMINDDKDQAWAFIYNEYNSKQPFEFNIAAKKQAVRDFNDYVADYLQKEYDSSDHKKGDQLFVNLDALYTEYLGPSISGLKEDDVDLNYLYRKLGWIDDWEFWPDCVCVDRISLIITVAK